MKLIGFDTETSGLDATKNFVTEVGLVLFDAETKQPARVSGFLVKVPGGVSTEITKLTGITNEMLETYGVESRQALTATLNMMKLGDIIVAHNAPFDRAFLESWCQRENFEPPKLPWADTRTDLPAAAYQLGKSASLKYLCCDHSIIYSAHRAVNDVLALFELLSRYDITEFIKRSQTPNIKVRAVVSYDDRLLARERGYHWVPENKLWVRELKADEVDAEKLAAPFPVVLMENK